MPLGDRIGDKSESRYCGVETDFDDDMPNLLYRNISSGGFDFVVSTLMDPSYRPSLVKKDESKSLALPFAGSDLVLSPSQWSGHVVGKISSWIDLDSEDDKLRADSEITLKQEIAWASHLSLQACLLPVPKGTACSNYARCVNQILQSLNNMQLWLRIPLVKADEDDVSDEKSEKSGLADSWELWNSFRYLCEHHSQLSVALEVLSSLPSANSLGRWIGEPVKAALINTNSFLTNARGYPCLSKRHQKLLTSFFNYSVQIVLCGKGAQTSGSSFKSADHSDGVEKHPLKSYLDYVGYLYQRMDPLPYCASADVRTETKSMTGSAEVDVSAIKEKKKKKKKDKNCEVSKDIASEDAQLKADKVMESDNSKEHSSVNKRKKKIGEIGNGDASKDLPSEKVGSGAKKGQSQGISSSAASENIQTVDADIGTDCKKKDKRKKKKVLSKNIDGHSVEKVDEKEGFKSLKKRKRDVEAADSSEKTNSERKRVRFSDNVEVVTFPEHLKYRKLSSEGDVVQGKRYTAEEDAKIMQAIDDYIVEHGLAKNVADKDLDENWKNARNMIMNCKEHSKLKGCWKDISLAIPWRTLESIYQRAHLIYERAEDRKWTKEEIDIILSFHEKNGPKWRELGDFLGKSRKHVKDAYRRNKLSGEKKGAWTQDEYQKLFDLVNHDIILKAVQEKKVKHGMLRDNIAWGAISEAIGTRASPTCCNKWYYQLCSSMVVEGKWSDTDDYKLVDALYNQDVCCIEDVEWDSLLEHRSGDLCRRRWAEMARNLGEYRQKPFLEQVEVLHQRYDRELLEAREAYEKKDPVDV